jgi:hypothetical protein
LLISLCYPSVTSFLLRAKIKYRSPNTFTNGTKTNRICQPDLLRPCSLLIIAIMTRYVVKNSQTPQGVSNIYEKATETKIGMK